MKQNLAPLLLVTTGISSSSPGPRLISRDSQTMSYLERDDDDTRTEDRS